MRPIPLEMSVALSIVLDRLSNLRLDPEGDDPHIRGQVFRSQMMLKVIIVAHLNSARPFGSFRRRAKFVMR
jgi:hypothetical protein